MMDDKKVILVTGCAGETGSYVCELLLKKYDNIFIVGIDNFFKGTLDNLKNIIDHDRFQFIESDIRDFHLYYSSLSHTKNLSIKVKPAFEIKDLFIDKIYQEAISPDCDEFSIVFRNLDEIYNFAAVVPTKYFYERPDLTYKVNCEAAIKLFDIAREVGVKKFLNASSSEIYGNNSVYASEDSDSIYDSVNTTTRWSYAHGKILTEYYMNHFKNDIYVVHLRYANCAGRRDIDELHVIPYIINKLINHEKLELNSRPDEFKRSFLSMEDAASASVCAMENGSSGEPYNVGTYDEVSIRELFNYCCKHLNIDPESVDVSWCISREGDPVRRILDHSKLNSLGWTPECSLGYIIEQVIEGVRDGKVSKGI